MDRNSLNNGEVAYLICEYIEGAERLPVIRGHVLLRKARSKAHRLNRETGKHYLITHRALCKDGRTVDAKSAIASDAELDWMNDEPRLF